MAQDLKTECYPIALLPGLSKLFLDFAERREALTPFYPASAYGTEWMKAPAALATAHRAALCDLLEQQSRSFGAGERGVREHCAVACGGRRRRDRPASDAVRRSAVHHP